LGGADIAAFRSQSRGIENRVVRRPKQSESAHPDLEVPSSTYGRVAMIDLARLFSTDGFMPHGMCYLWRPDILAVQVGADSLIALASVVTAILLVKLVPAALRFPTPSALLAANANLAREILERKYAEQRVLEINASLEARVKEREIMLQEIHHRVKNNLQVISSLINMQAREVEDGPIRSALIEYQARIGPGATAKSWRAGNHPGGWRRWHRLGNRFRPGAFEFPRRATGVHAGRPTGWSARDHALWRNHLQRDIPGRGAGTTSHEPPGSRACRCRLSFQSWTLGSVRTDPASMA
jgi:hypothetical protein